MWKGKQINSLKKTIFSSLALTCMTNFHIIQTWCSVTVLILIVEFTFTLLHIYIYNIAYIYSVLPVMKCRQSKVVTFRVHMYEYSILTG